MRPKPNLWLEALKIAGVLATIAASALGSYRAAKSDARSEADASYAALKQAVEHLEETQKMIWDVVMRSPATLSKSLDAPLSGGLPRPFVGLHPLPRNMEMMLSKK
jgi:hypothetical protein